jgi:hypothetical protein
MTLDDFKKLKIVVEKDLKWDKDTAQSKEIQLSTLYAKYLDVFMTQANIRRKLELKKLKLYGTLYHKYKFDFQFQLDTKSEVESYINADDEYYDLSLELSNQEMITNYLGEVLKEINTIGFNIKDYIELEKLKRGVY